MGAVTLVHDGGADRDATLDQEFPTTNDGAWGTFRATKTLDAKSTVKAQHAIVLFDLKAFLPASATIVSAVWWIRIDPLTLSTAFLYHARRCTRTDWVEAEVTWDNYKAGSPWTAPGGDMADPTVDFGALYPPGAGWRGLDISTLVTDAWSNRAGICTFIFRRYDTNSLADGCTASSKEAPVAYQHHLRVTYTLDGRTFQVFIR